MLSLKLFPFKPVWLEEGLLKSCCAFLACCREFETKFPTEFVREQLPAIQRAPLRGIF